MFAWILILSFYVALFSLILYDATKEDSEGSAISIAAKKIKAFSFWAMLKARKLRGTLSYRTSQTSVSKSRVSMTTPQLESAISEAVKKAARTSSR